MKIAQVAPLYESVPPKYYGGTERVVSYLTEELVRQGHEVTLFASGDSVTKAQLATVCDRALRLDNSCKDELAIHMLLLEYVYQCAEDFDVIHFHTNYLHFSLARRNHMAHVTTLHGRLDIPELTPLFSEFRDMPLVSISDAQRKALPSANWQRTVYHGLPPGLYRFRPEHENYLAFLGRVSPEKGVDRAIEIARRLGMPIKIAAKVDVVDREYFENVIKPLLRHPDVEYVGEIGESEKGDFLGNACALLFPIDWPEPFGMVMIEAMACGTPVIAYGQGSVREIMNDVRTGFIVSGLDEAVEAARRIPELSRQGCRQVFEERFTAGRMAADYLKVYEGLTERKNEKPALRGCYA